MNTNQLPRAEAILQDVCFHFGTLPADVKSRSKKRNLVEVRQIFSRVCRDNNIGVNIAGWAINRDHATISISAKRTNEVREVCAKYFQFIHRHPAKIETLQTSGYNSIKF